MHGFQIQQSRWSKGLTQCAIKLLPGILRARLPKRVKLEAWMHLTPNISYPLMMIVCALMLPVMIVRFYMGWLQMVVIDLPLIIASFWSISAFYLVAQRELFPKTWKRAIFFLPALMAAGVALSVNNTRSVLEAIFRVQTPFARTPKYAIGEARMKLENVKYRSRVGWLPYIELACGSYFGYMVIFAIDSYNYLAVPFLLLFVSGYLWAASTKLCADWKGRIAWHRARRLELGRQAG